jgi:hypothetical protein
MKNLNLENYIKDWKTSMPDRINTRRAQNSSKHPGIKASNDP